MLLHSIHDFIYVQFCKVSLYVSVVLTFEEPQPLTHHENTDWMRQWRAEQKIQHQKDMEMWAKKQQRDAQAAARRSGKAKRGASKYNSTFCFNELA